MQKLSELIMEKAEVMECMKSILTDIKTGIATFDTLPVSDLENATHEQLKRIRQNSKAMIEDLSALTIHFNLLERVQQKLDSFKPKQS